MPACTCCARRPLLTPVCSRHRVPACRRCPGSDPGITRIVLDTKDRKTARLLPEAWATYMTLDVSVHDDSAHLYEEDEEELVYEYEGKMQSEHDIPTRPGCKYNFSVCMFASKEDCERLERHSSAWRAVTGLGEFPWPQKRFYFETRLPRGRISVTLDSDND